MLLHYGIVVSPRIPLQMLAVGYQTASAVKDYCLNNVAGLYQARLTDPACSDSSLPYPQGFPNYYTPLDSALQVKSHNSQFEGDIFT